MLQHLRLQKMHLWEMETTKLKEKQLTVMK